MRARRKHADRGGIRRSVDTDSVARRMRFCAADGLIDNSPTGAIRDFPA
jgi:hypothetical protein